MVFPERLNHISWFRMKILNPSNGNLNFWSTGSTLTESTNFYSTGKDKKNMFKGNKNDPSMDHTVH